MWEREIEWDQYRTQYPGPYEDENKPSSSMKGEEFLNQARVLFRGVT
jgi:hypothetical protein